MKQANAAIEIVVPDATIYSEHPAVVVDRNVTAAERPIVDAFMQYLWEDAAQQAFVQYHFRSITNDSFNSANKDFAHINQPFTVADLGGCGVGRQAPSPVPEPDHHGQQVPPGDLDA